MIMTSGLLSRLPAIVIVLISATGVAAAQLGVARSTSGAPEAQRLGPGSGPGIGMTRPGFMMGPGMMRGTGMWNSRFDGPCDPSVAGIPEWRIDEIETRGAADGRATWGPRRFTHRVRQCGRRTQDGVSARNPPDVRANA
jgi:hypothetical protein